MIINKYRSIEVTKDDIMARVPEGLSLSDTVLVFNYEGEWIVIPLSTLVKYPIIYLLNSETKEFGSIVCCLLTLRTMYVFEKVRWVGYKDLEAKFNNVAGELMGFEHKLDKNGERIVEFKRSQTKFQSLRSALIEYGDIKYLNLKIEMKTNLIPLDYYKNSTDYEDKEIKMSETKLNQMELNPKQLCTLIQYTSKDNIIKTTIIVGKGNNIDVSYDSKKNGTDEYLSSSGEQLIDKKAFIMQILYYTAKLLFPKVKYIQL
jgi:hypothetical protein